MALHNESASPSTGARSLDSGARLTYAY